MSTSSQEKLSRFCASIGNSTRVSIMEAVASKNNCVNGDVIEVSDLGKFATVINLKGLKKTGLINGTFHSKKMSYCIDYEKLDEFKTLFDNFYNNITKNRSVVNPTNEPCPKNKTC